MITKAQLELLKKWYKEPYPRDKSITLDDYCSRFKTKELGSFSLSFKGFESIDNKHFAVFNNGMKIELKKSSEKHTMAGIKRGGYYYLPYRAMNYRVNIINYLRAYKLIPADYKSIHWVVDHIDHNKNHNRPSNLRLIPSKINYYRAWAIHPEAREWILNECKDELNDLKEINPDLAKLLEDELNGSI